MLVKTLLNKIHRFKRFVYHSVTEIKMGDEDILEVLVLPRKNSKAHCSKCEKRAPLYDTRGERLFEFVPLWNIRVFFRYRMRRVNCKNCGVVIEFLPWADGKRHLTKTYMQFLASWAKKMSWLEVANSFKTSWKKVFYSWKKWASSIVKKAST